MATTRSAANEHGRRRFGARHGGPALIAIGAVMVLFGALDTTTAGPAAGEEVTPTNDKKVYVCKYVGTPFVDERLQTGDNPIWVSENAIPDPEGDGVHVGDEFADQQGRSVVIQIGGSDPGIEACPAPLTPTTTTAPATTTTEPATTTTTAAPTTTTPAVTTTTTTPAVTTTTPAVTTTVPATTTSVEQLGPETTTTVAPVGATTTTSQVASEAPNLPGTGGPSWLLIAIGAAVMAAGTAMTVVARRRATAR